MVGAAHAMKRIPLIKFPNRHPASKFKFSGPETIMNDNAKPILFPSSATSSVGLAGKASAQLKRTPMSQEEIDAVLADIYASSLAVGWVYLILTWSYGP